MVYTANWRIICHQAHLLDPFRGTISTTIDICAVFCLPFPPPFPTNFLDSSMVRKIEACLLPLEADEKADDMVGIFAPQQKLGGGFKYFSFHPENWGFMIQFDEHIFQRGWFNHQLENLSCLDPQNGEIHLTFFFECFGKIWAKLRYFRYFFR